ncbi:YfhO family protein [Zhouia amylolytica]|uniref:Bacterial membrane protein YfhO n=1 Tax=Zhouia amylolytica AD3 TaxID=1286632 RepID=W2UQ93_9FLAO|nr:YfhO family protein [Zhouia amylolytica]ETN96310.1 bacterial membrane protein YfhO [Zhouia amylolytica AD3]
MNFSFKKLVPHIVVFVLFIAASLAYFSPVLQGKKIFQSDIVQYIGMAKEQNDFRKVKGEEPYWTNSAFGGMPTYQLGANYPHNYVKKLDKTIRFLPRPADYLFLYFIGFYILLLVLRIDWKLAFIGSLAFGFSTYLIIILGVGHNAKAHAIGYFPLVLAGIVLSFRRQYIWGFLLTAIAMALEINANHFQMTYYLMLLVVVLGVVYLLDAFKKKELPHFFKTVGLLFCAVILGVATNATNIMATKQYADWSTRGTSELTINPDGSPKENSDGLSYDYITEYSYGKAESLNLFASRLFGGGNSEALGEDSNTYQYLVNKGVPRDQAKSFTSGLPTYWGDQPIVAAPAYIGAVVVFLFVLALFLVQGRLKWWLVGGTILSLLLSWGKNFSILTDLMIDYMPMYDKFRAVSSIQVILELCIPVLGIVGLSRMFSPEVDHKQKLDALKRAGAIIGGLIVVLFIGKGFFSFDALNDAYYSQQFSQMGLPELMDFLKEDRKAMYSSDLLRSFGFVLVIAIVLYAYLKNKLKVTYAYVAIGLLLIFDLVGVDKRYVNKEDFVSARKLEKPFQPNGADVEILKDTAHFRVFDPSEGLNGARTSYFHNSVGGYHAAKPGRLQELFEYQISKNNIGTLNMLNVKYIIQQNDKGLYPARNPYANGNAWFVETLKTVQNADQEMQALDSLNFKTEAVVDVSKFGNLISGKTFEVDSLANISLKKYEPNHLVYRSNNNNDGLAVFSEMYYPHGWQVSIDGKKAESFRVNYVLRALNIPAGKHTIEFKFQPEVIQTGSAIALAGSLILVLILFGGIGYTIKEKRSMKSE